MIAICHPGKFGDALYSWPLARHLYRTTGHKADFITTEYCRPLKRLARSQEWCNDLIVSKDYVLKDWGCGGQPPEVPVHYPNNYTSIIQCGFKDTPDCYLGDWIAKQAGVPADLLPLPLTYDTPPDDMGLAWHDALSWKLPMPRGYGKRIPFVVLASRGVTTYIDLFREFARKCAEKKIAVVEVGGRGDQISDCTVDGTDLDFLLTAAIIRESRAFVGLMSSQLVLANGFPIQRIAVHDGRSWDMRHVLKSEWNQYPINPTADEIVGMLKL